MKPTPDAPLSVQAALREVELRLAALESVDPSGVRRTIQNSLDALDRDLRTRISLSARLSPNDVFRGGSAHMHGYVPDPGGSASQSEYSLNAYGSWAPGVVEPVPWRYDSSTAALAALGSYAGTSPDQRVVNVHGSLAVLGSMSVETVRARNFVLAGGDGGSGTGPWVLKSGDTMTGALALAGVSTAPTAAVGTSTTQIATTAFVDAEAVAKAGDSMTGLLSIKPSGASLFANIGHLSDATTYGAISFASTAASPTAGTDATHYHLAGTTTDTLVNTGVSGSVKLRVANADRFTVADTLITNAVALSVPDLGDTTPTIYFAADSDTGICYEGSNQFVALCGGSTQFRFGSGYCTTIGTHYFANDSNFSIYSDASGPTLQFASGDAIYYDTTNNLHIWRIGSTNVANINANSMLTLTSSTAYYPRIDLQSTNAGAEAPYILFSHLSASPAVNDIIGVIDFNGKDSAGNIHTFGEIFCMATDVTNTSEDGVLYFSTIAAGSYTTGFTTSGTDIYVVGNMSALSITDRTDAAKDKTESFDIVKSFDRKDGQLDKDKLDKAAKVEGEHTEIDGTKVKWTGRNLSITVSALMEVCKDLISRVEVLEAA